MRMTNLTQRSLSAALTFVLGIMFSWLVHVPGRRLATSQRVSAPIANEGEIIFEGTLLAKSEYSGIACGVLYVHQVAKYRIEKILSGEYQAREIVVDHPACDEDVFQDIPVGSRLRIWVQVRENYSVITLSPGIRDERKIPQVFYVAVVPPEKIGS